MKKIIVFILVGVIFCGVNRVSGLSAKSCVVINGDTGDIIYAENADISLPMASTTKIMTALLLCEYGNLDKEITVTRQMVLVEGTSMGLMPEDRISLKDLLYGMMLCSGNDAANAVAVVLGGSTEKFAEIMNKRAKELSLNSTSFATPSGLDAENHFTTAYELALITREAFKHKEFRNAVSSKTATVCFGNPPQKRKITNHNKLLRMYDDVIGVKTGFTRKSGRCLVSASNKDGKFVIAVTLNDPNDWQDHRRLLNIGISAVDKKTVYKRFFETKIIGADKKSVKTEAKGFSVCAKKEQKITREIYAPKFCYAPIRQGETVGYAVFYCDNKEISRQNLRAQNNINAKKITKFEKTFQNLFCIFRGINEG
ncbi:MAG: D-alanyl-D-alanine carboxypeptidase [Clostridia bacterium]|nr:D-alanyl-D-alanine carboxypeptidase [Clostridia bacterium]